MTTTHTPGPWAFCNHTLCQANGKFLHLGEWRESPGLGSAAAANMRLIAAAPDLLAALQRLVHPMADDSDVEFAHAAVARATYTGK
jgi:hypothetical protein